MAKVELNVLFKKMQRDDKKEVLKFEVKGDTEQKTAMLYELAGNIVNFEIDGCEAGMITAEFAKINRDSKKTVLDFNLKGDSEEKALKLYEFAGHNVTLMVEPSQMSLEDFYEETDQDPDEDPHEGIDYTVDVTTGTVNSVESKDDGMFDVKDEELPG